MPREMPQLWLTSMSPLFYHNVRERSQHHEHYQFTDVLIKYIKLKNLVSKQLGSKATFRLRVLER